MTPHSRIRRIGWIAALATCTALYLALHLKVHSVRSEVIAAERQIVALEQRKLLLETEFETRANQLQLAAWNTIDFGYTAPTASQFLESERQLASFGSPRAADAPEPIRVAGATGADEPAFPTLVSPLTGRPIDPELLEAADGERLAAARGGEGAMRIPLGAVIGIEAR
ncbi:MAG TPA: hypothetical protein VLC53_00430 [Myxococcota bacterium]|nr:hypothetical protein [Myxococcota bacterium]